MFGIGAVLGKVFGTEKALTSIVDGVSSGLDKLVYTSEEKADDASAERSEARRMVIEWMAATKGQNLARRIIALSVVFVWLFNYILSGLFSIIAVWFQPLRDKLLEGDIYTNPLIQTSDILKTSANDMAQPVMLILAFYFAAPHMGKIADSVMAKFSGDKK